MTPFPWIVLHLFVLGLMFVLPSGGTCEVCKYVGIALLLLGIIVWTMAKKVMGRTEVKTEPTHFVKTGIYAKMRHPMYVGVLLILVGFALTRTPLWGTLAVLVLLLPAHIHRAKLEERKMIEKFGDAYKEYQKETLF